MPIAVTEIPAPPVSADPPRKRWTRVECATLEASGLLDQENLELVEGELISKMGKKRPHVNSFTRLHEWLVQVFGWSFVNAEAPIDVRPEDNPTNEPVPDLIVLRQDDSHFTSNPQPQDLRLVAEIADTSLGFDTGVKATLYARAGVPEYWVLDVSGRRLLVHRNPQSGTYTDVAAYSEHESVSPLAAPQARFRVADAFPVV
ncbi:MAG: Uma2 family endonuclease [Bryobacteraceae bacterium]|jgi:Uma2 family endonuclease